MCNWHYSLYREPKEDRILRFDYDYKDDYNIIVCRQDSTTRRFTMFRSPVEFKKFESSVADDEKCFFEVIMGKRPRKPYFDIDVSLEEYPDMKESKMNYLIDILIENIKDLLVDYNPKILVFTSHRPDKLSYHIVVDKVFLETNEDSKLFAEKVLPMEMKEFADSKVYNSAQQLRIVNSTKYGKNNKKVIKYALSENFYIPKDIKLSNFKKEMYILYASLVTFTSECTLYRIEGRKKRKPMRKGNASELDIDKAMECLHKRYTNFEFKQARELNGNILIELVSNGPYHCNIHNRIHENENAYITIKGMMKNVWFDCRRIEEDEKKLAPEFIGHLFSPKRNNSLKNDSTIKFSLTTDEN